MKSVKSFPGRTHFEFQSDDSWLPPKKLAKFKRFFSPKKHPLIVGQTFLYKRTAVTTLINRHHHARLGNLATAVAKCRH